MKAIKKSSKSRRSKTFRIIANDLKVRIATVRADCESEAIEKAMQLSRWRFQCVDQELKLVAIRRITERNSLPIHFFDEPIIHSPYQG